MDIAYELAKLDTAIERKAMSLSRNTMSVIEDIYELIQQKKNIINRYNYINSLPEAIAQIQSMCVQGATLHEISRATGLSTTTVARRIEKYKLKTKKE